MRIRMAGATDVGRRRSTNQDAMFYDGQQGIVLVADGIGGRKGGEIAAHMAVDGMKKAFLETECIRHEEIHTFLASSVDQVNQVIVERSLTDQKTAGMGTTLNCLMFVAGRLYIAHVGDSRTYLYYKGNLWQLTLDHNIETFIERGWMSKAHIQPGTKEGALVRSLGLSQGVEVDIYDKEVKAGEIYLTCSDGLTGMVSDQRIAALFKERERDISSLPKILVNEANRNGGRDNITVVISEVCEA